jgi:hypothetical protein
MTGLGRSGDDPRGGSRKIKLARASSGRACLAHWNFSVGRRIYRLHRKPEAFMRVLSWLFGGKEPDDMMQIDNPAAAFEKPSDVLSDTSLTHNEKKNALETWEQDARQLMTASNEGMAGRKEGLDPDDHHRMADVVRAKEALGEKPNQKPAH